MRKIPNILVVLCAVSTMCQAEKVPWHDKLQYRQYPPDASALPSIPCPQLFQYRFNYTRNFWYGLVTVPLNQQSNIYVLEVNMTVNTAIQTNDGIHANVLSNQTDVVRGTGISYCVTFPYVDLVPTLTQILFNGVTLCTGPHPPWLPTESRSDLYSRSVLRVSLVDDTAPIGGGGLARDEGAFDLPSSRLHSDNNESPKVGSDNAPSPKSAPRTSTNHRSYYYKLLNGLFRADYPLPDGRPSANKELDAVEENKKLDAAVTNKEVDAIDAYRKVDGTDASNKLDATEPNPYQLARNYLANKIRRISKYMSDS